MVILAKVQNDQTKKNGKLPAKEDEEIPWNNIYVDVNGPYIICIKVRK